jgi:hypothetical protein
MPLRGSRRISVAALACATTLAHAAHPLISEDTGTQGTGKFELEVGSEIHHVEGGGRVSELDPQLSWGARDDIDVILRPTYFWLTGSAADSAGRHSGFGTTSLDVKWRPVERKPWSFAVRAGVDLPTSQGDIGPHEGGGHVIAIATYEVDAIMATFNAAYSHLPKDIGFGERRDILRFSAGALTKLTDAVRLATDLATAQSANEFDRTWPAVGVVGFIVTVPWGFDVDAGVQLPLNKHAPSTQWMLGATVRW